MAANQTGAAQETSGTRLFDRLNLAIKFAVVLGVILLVFFLIAAVAVHFHLAGMATTLTAQLQDSVVGLPPDQAAATIAQLSNQYMTDISWQVIGLMLAVTIGVIVVVYFQFVVMIRKRLWALAQMFQDVAEGEADLRRRVDVRGVDGIDRLGKLFNTFLERMHNTISQVVSAAEQLNHAAAEVNSITATTTNNVMQQQAETQQLSTAMNEMAASVNEVANTATSAANSASSAESEARNGKQVVDQTVNGIRSLADEVTRANDVILKVQSDSEEIGTVLDVIRAIAEQTNLLALNAAIEAARAGEQGRGFAVVADEVRTLASRTQQSTEEIQTMIERLQSGANDAAKVMDVGREQAQSSVEQAGQAGRALEAITKAVTEINQLNDQIASAAEQQSSVAHEMDQGLTNIAQLASTTADDAQNTSTESAQLTQLANQLQQLVNQFKV